MDSTTLILSFLFGMVGFGFFTYGRKMGRLVPVGAGVGLMVAPYFTPGAAATLIVCLILTATPFLLRNA